jgi:hypothetical protein
VNDRLTALFLALGLLAPGCAKDPPEPGGANASRRIDFSAKTRNHLTNLGRAYEIAVITRPPKNWDDLKEGMEGHVPLKSPRDEQPYEVIWGFNPGQVTTPSHETLLAWERTSDPGGGRYVLMADFHTVSYLQDEEFQKATKAKGK